MRRLFPRVACRPCIVAFALVLFLPHLPAAGVKTDLDADISGDGRIDDNDPRDNGKVQNSPPGLAVTVGRLEKLVLRNKPKSLASGYVRLTIVSNPGEWELLKNPNRAAIPRRPEGGRIRIWQDSGRKELVLDSHDATKQTKLWRLSYNFPLALVPVSLYAEGISPSKESGDVVLALLHSSSPRVDATSPTRDILVMTVRKGEPTRPRITRDEPGTRSEPSVDLVGDVNQDGTIDPGDPADNGDAEGRAPGLSLPIASLQHVLLRCVPKSSTEGYVRLAVQSLPKQWIHQDEPNWLPRPCRPGKVHIRVWADPERRTLVLDSRVRENMMALWMLSAETPFERVPTELYVEGLAPSVEDGDILLALGYGLEEAYDQPELVQDILVGTVPQAKIAADMVGDLNRDGTIDPDSPDDNGDAEGEPPGLTVPVGTVQELSLRCVPKSWTEGYVRFTVLAGAGEWAGASVSGGIGRKPNSSWTAMSTRA
jgi:hypothetical protein